VIILIIIIIFLFVKGTIYESYYITKVYFNSSHEQYCRQVCPQTLIEKNKIRDTSEIKSKVTCDYIITTHIKKIKILYDYTIKIKYEVDYFKIFFFFLPAAIIDSIENNIEFNGMSFDHRPKDQHIGTLISLTKVPSIAYQNTGIIGPFKQQSQNIVNEK
jgi:hypothetical protein